MAISVGTSFLFGVLIAFLLQIWLIIYLIRERYRVLEKRYQENTRKFLEKYDDLKQKLERYEKNERRHKTIREVPGKKD